jgi:methionine--tRNA ligase beta chain
LGEAAPRQILSGIAKVVEPEALVGTYVPVVANLAPRLMMGMESQGMILCADSESGPILIHPARDVAPGSVIK